MAEEADEGDLPAAARQVREYVLTLDALLPRAAEARAGIFTYDLLCDLHHKVMASDPDYRGALDQLRTVTVWIGPRIEISVYNPAPAADVPECLRQTVDYMRSDE